MHGLLDRVMHLLEVPWKTENGYRLEAAEGIWIKPHKFSLRIKVYLNFF